MSKKHSKRATRPEIKAPPRAFAKWRKYLPTILLFAVSICYWTPLTSPNASIQWDAADEFQPGQQYLSAELHAGHLPFWTPYIWAGFPFLADPQLGAWYPLNWPFLLIGPSPRVFQAENLLHALLACFGAYLLAKKLFGSTAAALFAGLSYGLSGFFAGHSSHTPMFQTAAWLPWLLLLFARAFEGHVWRNGALASLPLGVPMACSIAMKRPGISRMSMRDCAKAAIGWRTPAAASSLSATNMSRHSGPLGRRTRVARARARVR